MNRFWLLLVILASIAVYSSHGHQNGKQHSGEKCRHGRGHETHEHRHSREEGDVECDDVSSEEPKCVPADKIKCNSSEPIAFQCPSGLVCLNDILLLSNLGLDLLYPEGICITLPIVTEGAPCSIPVLGLGICAEGLLCLLDDVNLDPLNIVNQNNPIGLCVKLPRIVGDKEQCSTPELELGTCSDGLICIYDVVNLNPLTIVNEQNPIGICITIPTLTPIVGEGGPCSIPALGIGICIDGLVCLFDTSDPLSIVNVGNPSGSCASIITLN